MTTLNLDNIDLSSFTNPDKPTQQDTDAEVHSIVNDAKTQKVKASMSSAFSVNPDQQANTNKLARKAGLPAEVVEADPQAVETDLKLKNINLDTMSQRSPNTAAFLTDFNKAAIAHDDIDVLEEIEGSLTQIGNVAEHGLHRVAEGITGTFSGMLKSVGLAINSPDQELLDSYIARHDGGGVLDGQTKNPLFEPIDAIRQVAFGLRSRESQARVIEDMRQQQQEATDSSFYRAGQAIDDWMRANTYRMPELEQGGWKQFLGTDVPQGLGSMFSFIMASAVFRGAAQKAAPGMTGAEASMVGAAIPGSMVNYSAEFDRAVQDGATLEQAFKAAGAAKFIGATEGLPIIGFLDRLDKRAGGALSRSIRDILKQGTEEAIQEGGVEIANAVAREMVYAPERGVWGILGDAGYDSSVGFTTGALIEGISQLLIPGRQRIRSPGADSVADESRRQMDAGVDEQQSIDRMNDLFSQSKVRDRDPEAFRDFVREADGAKDTHIYIDAEQVQSYLADKDPESDAGLQVLAERAKDAAEQGVDVAIPVDEFASVIAGSEHFTALRDYMTLKADSVPPARQEEARQQAEEYINNLVTEAQENVSQYVEAQEVFESVRDQLIDTGMVTPQNAKVMAQVVPAYMSVFARRNNISIAEAYERSGLLVEGPQTGRAEEMIGEHFEQPEIPDVGKERFERDFAEGTTGLEGALDEQGNVKLVHYARRQLTETDPSRWGQGLARRTPSERQRTYTGIGRTYFGVTDATENPYRREPGLGGVENIASVPAAGLYPFNADPEGLRSDDPDTSERNIRDAGYLGYFVSHPQLGKVVALFEPTRVYDNEGFERAARDRRTRARLRNVAPLEGAPTVSGATGPDANIVRVAEQYAFNNGIEIGRQSSYVQVDPERGERIAEAYEQMEHNPADPQVQEAYEELKRQTRAQYDALVADGYEFFFFDETNDPYDGNPWNAVRDLRQNKRMGVFTTEAGFGSSDLDVSDNPLLEDTGIEWGFGAVDGPKKRVLANDLFRAVHDAFGHSLEGAGFRARGEENAWQAHVRLFTGKAVAAMTTETRGQNSWLNFGPYGEQNQSASVEETIFADQKTGLMPEWTWMEGVSPNQTTFRQDQPARNELGLYSAVEKAVIDMNLPQWKKGGEARGADIWAKINSTGGLKKEELEWLGLEEFLTVNEDAKFTRDQVAQFVRENGVVIEEITADQRSDEDQEFNWEETVQEDESNYDWRVDEWMTEFDQTVNHNDDPFKELTDHPIVGVDLQNVIDGYMERTEFDDLPGEVQDLLAQREGVVSVSEQQLNLPGIPERDYEVELADIDRQVYNLMLEEEDVQDIIREQFTEQAREQYMDDPIIEYEDSETGITISGNDNEGYTVSDGRGQLREMVEIFSFSEAEVRAADIAREDGQRVDENDPTAAKWEEYVTPGSYDNYRELKLTLPEVDGDFENDVHFPDRNLLAFLRVTDRELIVDPERVEREKEEVRAEDPGAAAFFTGKQKAFFIDEFQSDWHQQGRQQGYSTGEFDAGELDQQANDLNREAFDLIQEVSDEAAAQGRDAWEAHRRLDNKLKESIVGGGQSINNVLVSVANNQQPADVTEQVESLIADNEKLQRAYDLYKQERELIQRARSERYGVPDAPFKGDAWMNLGIKRSLIHAAQNGYEAVAWADSNVLMDRWSENYKRLYETQYDTKMTSMVKKLTKQKPAHMNFDGEAHQHQELGYWVIELTPELRERILRDGFPLFQRTGDQPRGYYDPSNSVIRLTEAADLSTFLHEFAHFIYEMELTSDSPTIPDIHAWYQRNRGAVVAEANEYLSQATPDFTRPAPGVITEDDLSAFLSERTAGDQAKDEALRRATHEQFARGFEAYLMEGKAPSIELRNVFRTFARWLADIYRSIRDALRVNLDDDMRAVFDRLLATEDQIEAARARSRAAPLFTDAVMAGMTEEEFAAYQEQQAAAEGKESETLRDQLIKQITRQTRQWWRDEKADITDEELTRLRNEPVYRAINTLRDTDIKLDLVTVREMVGEEVTNARGTTYTRIPAQLRNMTAGGQKGLHPDEAAALFDYESGAELLADIMAAPPIKRNAEERAEARMLDTHGDVFSDGTIEQQADEALQNEERGKLLVSELRALSKKTGSPTLDRMTIKAMAEDAIGKLPYRSIHPGKYRKAEVKAAQEAGAAMATGDTATARSAKARQVLNYYLGMAANDARNETLRIVDRMSRYTKKSVREEIQKAGNEYWEQIVKILNRFEFRKAATLRAVDQQNQDINTWMRARVEEDGDALILSPAVLNETYVTHWKNVPFADLQGVNDSVKNIEHVARYSNKMERMGEEVEFNRLVERWVNHMDSVAETRFTAQRTDVVQGRKWGRWAMAQMTKIPWMASWLDGGERAGMSHQILMQPFTDALDAKMRLWKETGAPVIEQIMNRSKADLKRHNRKIFIPEIKDEKNDGNLMGHQVLAVALNTGNQGNLRKLLLGEGWATQEDEATISFDNPKLQAVLRHMTASDWQLVQNIWDQMDTLYPQLAEVHRRTTGLVPPKVEATPVDTPFGRFRGGYYPVKYDPNRDMRAEQNEDRMNAQVESMFATNGSIQASVNASATNERTGYFAPIRLSLDIVPNHFEEVIQYITHHDAVREVNKLIRNKQVAQTIKAKLGPEEYAQLRPWLNDVAKDGREAPTKMFWDDMIARLRFGTTLGIMGFKASTGLIQYSGLSNTAGEIGGKRVVMAVRDILKGGTTSMREAWDFASSNSKVLNHRMNTMDREIKNAMKRIEGKRGILRAAQEAAMKHIALIQTYNIDLVSWHGAYRKALEEHGDEQRAYQYADWVIENVQGSGATKDMAQIMRGQSETGRMFTMFMTFFSSMWNAQRDTVRGARSGRYSVTNVAAKLMYVMTLPVLFEMIMRGDLVWDDEDEEESNLQKFLTAQALFPLQSIPFIRDVANGVIGPYGYNMSPIAQLMEQGTQTVPELIKRPLTDDEITRGQAKGATKFIGAAVGVPGVNQMWATGEHLYEVMEEGEDLTVRELLFGPERE